MIHNKKGCIINISSIWGLVGSSCEVHYSVSKAGVDAMTKSLAKELGPSNIRVNSIAPGIINTDMNKNLNEDDLSMIYEELDYKVNFIKELYDYREDYFKWRLDLIKEFDLPVKFVTHSKGRLMGDIVSFNRNKKNGIVIDKKLYECILFF